MVDAATADLTNLIRTQNQAKRDAPKMAQDYLDRTGQKIAERMRQLAPVKTGALRNSIRVITQPGKVQVGPFGIPYAAFQEFGTGTRGEFGGQMYEIRPKKAENLVFQVNGRWVSTKLVRHPGVPAHPYARPAAREVLGKLGDELAKTAAAKAVGK